MSLEYIPFMEILKTGMSEIDDDHRRLIKDFNAVVDSFHSGNPRSEVLDRLDRLLIELKKHFSLEETVLRKRLFPRLDAQTQAHRHLEADLAQRLASARQLDTTSACEALLKHMQVMFVEVLVRHDLDYKSHIMHTSAHQDADSLNAG